MITATLEGVTITQLWGDRKQFQRRVEDYAEREGMAVGFVIPISSGTQSPKG